MQHRKKVLIAVLFIFFSCAICELVSADILNSDWIGTLDKSYELAWQQKDDIRYNSYGTEFFLEYTYMSSNNKIYPSYCIEYYLKGPRNNNEYGKVRLHETNIKDEVINGLITIIRNGYPNVQNPYGTSSVSEAYYATSAAVHIWTMYYGVDEVAGNDLGWFKYKDGFVMNIANLNNYIQDYSTKSTSSGWHIIEANNNASSKRTWVAAMELLKDALEAEIVEPSLSLEVISEPYVDGEYVISQYKIISEYCDNITLKSDKNISGMNIEYADNNDSIVATVRIPVKSIATGQQYSLTVSAQTKGCDDPDNYYYLYHLYGNYQTMLYLDSDGVRNISSNSVKLTIPDLKIKVYYDLNYSGKNYIKGGNFLDMNQTSYNGKNGICVIGDVNYSVSNNLSSNHYKILNATFNKAGDINNCVLINTLLPSDIGSGFLNYEYKYLTFSCWIKTDKATSIKLCFGNSEFVYEKKLSSIDQWQLLTVHVLKLSTENNNLHLYTSNEAKISMYNLQLEEENFYTEYTAESSPVSDPIFTEHIVGDKYTLIYNGNKPYREYYEFIGWNTQKDGKGDYIDASSTVSDGDIVLYAIWSNKPTYKVYLHYGANGGNYIEFSNSISSDASGAFVLEVENKSKLDLNFKGVKSGWDFIGWSYENYLAEPEESIVDEILVDGKDIHLYANYKKTHKIYYHYYDEKSGLEQIISTVENYSYNNYVYKGVTYLPDYSGSWVTIPKVDGYSLKGWSTNPYASKDIDYEPNALIDFTSNEHYYAVYEKEITIKFYDSINETNQHKNDIGLHCEYVLNVNRNCKGETDYASFIVPKQVCVIEDYDFYGWSDTSDFNGSVVYYANNNGLEVKAADSMSFYALYTKSNSVRLYDYDFADKHSHTEREYSVYTYMNYLGDISYSKIKLPHCCICKEGWFFSGWTLSNNYNDKNKYAAGEEIIVTDDIYLYAVYECSLLINCHYLTYEDDKLKNNVEVLNVSGKMNSAGYKSITEATLPVIDSINYEEYEWKPLGYSDVSDNSDEISHKDGYEYIFDSNTDLYAVYFSNINVKFVDYNFKKNNQIISNSKYIIKQTCDKNITSVKFEVPTCLNSKSHENSGWINSPDYSREIQYLPGSVVETQKNMTLYAVYYDDYILTCNDYENDIIRSRIFTSALYTYYDGSKVGDYITIPEQCNNNSLESSDFWCKDVGFSVDYISGEKIIIYEDTILNAIYTKDIKVVFDANGGYFSDGSTEIEVTGSLFKNVHGNIRLPFFVSEAIPSKESYVFKELWNTKPDGRGYEYFHGETITTQKDIILYALWEKAEQPVLDVIDRYYFVDDIIEYEDIIRKIIAIDPKNEKPELKIVKVNQIDTSDKNEEEIISIIDTSEPTTYKIKVQLMAKSEIIEDSFYLCIVEKDYSMDKLRYISEEYLDTLSSSSKWAYEMLNQKLIEILEYEKEDARWIFEIDKEFK